MGDQLEDLLSELFAWLINLLTGPLLLVVVVCIVFFTCAGILGEYLPLFKAMRSVKRQFRLEKFFSFMWKAAVVVAVVFGVGLYVTGNLDVPD